jgi:CTD kinase subunit gamma
MSKGILPFFRRESILTWISKVSIYAHIIVLYPLDSLCETCLLVKSHTNTAGKVASNNNLFVNFITRDLGKIVDHVVPQGRQGLPNLSRYLTLISKAFSARSENTYRYYKVGEASVTPRKVDDVITSLNDPDTTLEEDQERQKRLREGEGELCPCMHIHTR